MEEFFTALNWRPKTIIMIDDLKENIEAVEKECLKQGIKFKGYLYLGAKKFEKKADEKIAMYQLKHLLTHNQWLPDDTAKNSLKTIRRSEIG